MTDQEIEELRERNRLAQNDINEKAAHETVIYLSDGPSSECGDIDVETVRKGTVAVLEADIAELREELLAAETGRREFYDAVVELREERERAAESMEKMQAEIDEQACTITALKSIYDSAEHQVRHLIPRLETEKKRVDMAAVCLNYDGERWSTLVECALMVLEEKDLRRECESCNGPCNVAGDTCLLCGASQPPYEERCPPRPTVGIAAACNEGSKT